MDEASGSSRALAVSERADALSEVPEFLQDVLALAGAGRGEERERRLDLAWLKLQQTVRRKCSLFEHLQV